MTPKKKKKKNCEAWRNAFTRIISVLCICMNNYLAHIFQPLYLQMLILNLLVTHSDLPNFACPPLLIMISLSYSPSPTHWRRFQLLILCTSKQNGSLFWRMKSNQRLFILSPMWEDGECRATALSRKAETKSDCPSRNADIQFASASISFVFMGTLPHIWQNI